MKSLALVPLLASALALCACHHDDDDAAKKAAADKAQVSGSAAAPTFAVPPTNAAPAPAPHTDEPPPKELLAPLANAPVVMNEVQLAAPIGVPICDDYAERVRRCLNSHVKGSDRSMLRGQTNKQLRDWQKLAATDRTSVETQCNDARVAARTSLGRFGCSDF